MLRIAICDDDRFFISHISKLTAAVMKEYKPELREFTGAQGLLSALAEGSFSPDIALIDIQMPDTDGISLAEELNRLAPECRIIYVSSYIDFATEVYDTQHSYYVLKTQLEERLPKALMKAYTDLNTPPSYVLIKNGVSVTKLPLRSLYYIERSLHKTLLYTAEECYTTSQSPTEFLNSAKGVSFIHCHQSYWVNTAAIQSMGVYSFKLTNGEEVPISRSKKAESKELFFRSLTE